MKNNVTYIWSAVVNNIARKVAAEPMENVDDNPQHIDDSIPPAYRGLIERLSAIDEERGDEIRQLRKEQAQMEMFDNPVKN